MDPDDDRHTMAANETHKCADAEIDPAPAAEVKKRKARLSEAMKLGADGNKSKFERFRSSSPVATHNKVIETNAEAADLPPRPKPEPGSMTVAGVHGAHERPNSRGLLHWRHYGVLPPAKTIEVKGEQVKVFVWTGLFQDIGGRQVFKEQEGGPDEMVISESTLDMWDYARVRWLQKRYGKPVAVSASREAFLQKNGLASLDYKGAETQLALSADFMRKWHTREFFPLTSLSFSFLNRQQGTLTLYFSAASEVKLRQAARRAYTAEQVGRFERFGRKLAYGMTATVLAEKIERMHEERKVFASAAIIGLHYHEENPGGFILLKYLGPRDRIDEFLRTTPEVARLNTGDRYELAAAGLLKSKPAPIIH